MVNSNSMSQMSLNGGQLADTCAFRSKPSCKYCAVSIFFSEWLLLCRRLKSVIGNLHPTTIIIGNLSKNQFDTLWLSGGNSHTNHSDMTKGTCSESWTPRLDNRVYLELINLIPFFWRLLETRLFSGTSFNELLLI